MRQSRLPLLLTRPAEASRRFAEAWRARVGPDAPVVIAPVVEIRPVPHDPPAGVPVFTSPQAPALTKGVGRHATAWCVGAKTAEAALAAGFSSRNADGDADDLVAAILASGDAGPFVHLRGAESRGDVAGRLTAAGRPCRDVVVYEQLTIPMSAEAHALLARPGPVLVPLFSPRSAERLGNAIAALRVEARLHVVAMSDAVAAAASFPWPVTLEVAKRPDADAMLDALVEVSQRLDSP